MKLGCARVRAGQCQQVLDEVSGLFGSGQDASERFAILVRGARTAEGELGAGTDQSDGSTEVVRGIGGELRKAFYGGFETGEHGVQCFGETAQFIIGGRNGEAAGQVLDADATGGLDDGIDGSEGAA